MKTISEDQLKFINELTRFLFFRLKTGEEIDLVKGRVVSEDNLPSVSAALDYIMRRGFCLIGGFSIRWKNEERRVIVKTAHIHHDNPKEGETVLPLTFKQTKERRPLVDSTLLEPILDYGK